MASNISTMPKQGGETRIPEQNIEIPELERGIETRGIEGAAQVRYVGPIANLFNPPYGMDIGFELGLIFAGISYLFLRRIELNTTGR